jgi:hypothetical protein
MAQYLECIWFMGAIRYICRISIVATDQPDARAEIFFIDKKTFTVGASTDADVKIKGAAVDPQHLLVKIDGQQLLVKNQGRGSTLVGSYKVPTDQLVPYKPGEGIRLGLSKQLVQIELFKKALEPHEESEAIIREAWEKAKQAESLVTTQRQVLAEQNKVTEDIAKEAQLKADEILKTAQNTKEQILKAAESEAASIKQNAEKDIVRTTNENNHQSELKVKLALEQAKDQAKALKKQAEKEAEGLIEAAKRTSQEQIDAAAQKAHDYLAESKREFEALQVNRNSLKNEIVDQEARNKMASEGVAKITIELKKMEEIKHKAQVDLDIEKERVRLAQEEMRKQVALQTKEKQILAAEIESFLSHFNKIKSELSEEKSEAQRELQRCKQEATEAVQMKEQAEYILDQHNTSVKELKKAISSLHHEQTTLAARINAAKDDEIKEREEMRNKINIEYFKRRELEEKWFAQQRQSEHEQKQKEKEAKRQLESERLVLQARKISEKLEPLLAIELTSLLSEEQLETLSPQLEKIVSPAVQHCLQEEYDFRKENWQHVRPPVKKSTWPTWRGHKLPLETQDLKILGVATLSFLVILAAVFGLRSNNQPQARSISSQGQTIVYSK